MNEDGYPVLFLSGIIVWINTAASNSYDSVLVPALCVFIAVWSTFFLEFWKRKQVRQAMLWGMTDFRDEEQQRPRVRPHPGYRHRVGPTVANVFFNLCMLSSSMAIKLSTL